MINIIVGTTLGSSEYVADHINDLLSQIPNLTHAINIHNTPNIKEISSKGIWLLITSTHGAGAFPDNIQPFIQSLIIDKPDLSEVKFAVIALGDSSYDTFCQAGKLAYNLLKERKAIPIAPIGCLCIDVTTTPIVEDIAEEWLKQHIDTFM